MDATGLYDSRQPGFITLCTIMLAFATLTVFLRCWSIMVSPKHQFGIDDFFVILTLPFIAAESALIYWWVSLGLGLHSARLPPSDVLLGPKIIFAAAFLYDACITLPKLSALFFYRRVFGRTDRRLNIALWVVGSMATAWLIAAWFSTIFQCIPVQKAWSTVDGGHCFKQYSWFLGTAIPSMIIDLCILIIPLPKLWGLQLKLGRKILLTGVFICGYCVIIVSIGRLVTLAKAGAALEEDLTWSTIEYIEWVQCEGPVSVISVSLPNIFALGKRIYEFGLKSAFRRGNIFSETLEHGGTFDSHGRSIKMQIYPTDRKDLEETKHEADSEIEDSTRMSHFSSGTSRSLLDDADETRRV